MQNTNEIHNFYMKEALIEAEKSLIHYDVPIGAVIVHDNKIIGRGYNQVELMKNPLAHAEIVAINEAIKNYGHKHLIGCSLYITLEPCAMCAGAIVLARIDNLYYAATDLKTGAAESLFNITSDSRLNHRCYIQGGIMAEESSKLIKEFFKKIRAGK